MAKQSLFDIAQNFLALDDLLDSLEGDVTGQEDAFTALWEQEEISLADKIDGYCQVIAQRLAFADAQAAEAKRLSDKAKSNKARAKWLKERLLEALQAMDRKSVETAKHKVTVANNGGKLPLIIDDPYSFDNGYWIEKSEKVLDKEMIREELEAGKTFSGARLGERGKSLRIK